MTGYTKTLYMKVRSLILCLWRICKALTDIELTKMKVGRNI